MVAYDLITKLEKLPYFNDLLTKGVVAINWIDYKFIYEWHKKDAERLRKKGYTKTKSNSQALSNASEEFNISESTVRWIIKKIKS